MTPHIDGTTESSIAADDCSTVGNVRSAVGRGARNHELPSAMLAVAMLAMLVLASIALLLAMGLVSAGPY